MGHLTSRRLLKCLAAPLLVAQVGCAAKGVQVAPTASASTVAEQDREACAAFARRQAEGVGSVDEPSVKRVVGALWIGTYVSLFGGLPAALVVGVIEAGVAAHRNHSARKYAHDATEEMCLKPVALAETLGPDHPDVAAALRDLANEYAYHEEYLAAEPLYQRALGIQERAFGPESGDVATTLEWYARLLRAMHRDDEATDVETRARTIRAAAERGEVSQAAAMNGTPAQPVKPPGGSAPMSPPADESE